MLKKGLILFLGFLITSLSSISQESNNKLKKLISDAITESDYVDKDPQIILNNLLVQFTDSGFIGISPVRFAGKRLAASCSFVCFFWHIAAIQWTGKRYVAIAQTSLLSPVVTARACCHVIFRL